MSFKLVAVGFDGKISPQHWSMVRSSVRQVLEEVEQREWKGLASARLVDAAAALAVYHYKSEQVKWCANDFSRACSRTIDALS